MATNCVARELAKWLRSIGVADVLCETAGRKHDRVTLTHNGKSRFVVCSRSPKDTDATLAHSKKTAQRLLQEIGFDN